MKKKAIIFGSTGQDGSLLAEFLLNKKYQVYAFKRRTSLIQTNRIDHLYYNNANKKNFYLDYCDITDPLNICKIILDIKPNEIYNLAAQSHVAVSFKLPFYSTIVDANGTLNILESIRISKLKKIKFYQASSSEMYGDVLEFPQNENTPFNPVSPYACAKVYSYWIVKNYRRAYGIFASNGILFNHEGETRGETFVTKKIINEVAKYHLTKKSNLELGNLYSLRDWGYSKDYVEGMWKILQYKKPDDFVLATNESYSVKDFVNEAFNQIGIKVKWIGKGLSEKGYDDSGNLIVKVNKKYFRPSEVDKLRGDYSKAKKYLNWEPKVKFKQLVSIMLKQEIRNLQSNENIKK